MLTDFEKLSNKDNMRLVEAMNKEVARRAAQDDFEGNDTWLEWRSRAVVIKERCVP
jgi:hypothetical protein